MQQKNDDLSRRFCREHINAVLTRDPIEKLRKDYETKIKNLTNASFAALIGSVLLEKWHRLDGAAQLIEYMDDHMQSLLVEKNEILMRTISASNEEIDCLNRLYLHPIEPSDTVDDSKNSAEATDGISQMNE